MKIMNSAALAGVLALGFASTASAQSAPPQIPSWFNLSPANPVATDGSPLPRSGGAPTMQEGRSAYVGDPVDGVVGAGLGTVGSVVGAGAYVAGSAIDTGFDTAGAVAGQGLAPLRNGN